MSLLRTVAFILATVLMASGYIASLAAFFAGPERAADYAQRIASPAVQGVALVILLACVVFAALPQKEEDAA